MKTLILIVIVLLTGCEITVSKPEEKKSDSAEVHNIGYTALPSPMVDSLINQPRIGD